MFGNERRRVETGCASCLVLCWVPLIALSCHSSARNTTPAPALQHEPAAAVPSPDPEFPIGGEVASPVPPLPLGGERELVIEPADYGPLYAERLRPGMSEVTPEEITQALTRQQNRLEDCYRWSYHGSAVQEGSLNFRIRFGLGGLVSKLYVGVEIRNGERLAHCAKDVLADTWLRRPLEHDVETDFDIEFKTGNYQPAKKAVRRPSRLYPSVSVGLYRGQKTAKLVKLTTPAMTVVAEIPRLRLGSVYASSAYSRSILNRTARQNLGAYRRCALQAQHRKKLHAGTLNIQVAIDATGNVSATLVTRAPTDRELATCLLAAVEELWYPPLLRSEHPRRGPRPYKFDLAFVIRSERQKASPPKPAPNASLKVREAHADALLALGDGHRAYEAYDALIRSNEPSKRGCFWRAGSLRAAMTLAPWLDDARVATELERFARFARNHQQLASIRKCVDSVAPVVGGHAMILHHVAQMRLGASIAEVVQLYDWVIAVQPWSRDGCNYRYYASEAKWRLAEQEHDQSRAQTLRDAAKAAEIEFCSLCATEGNKARTCRRK